MCEFACHWASHLTFHLSSNYSGVSRKRGSILASCLFSLQGHCFIMIFLRLAGSFRLFREYVCPAFSVPGFRLDVQRIGGILFDGLLSIQPRIKACGNQTLWLIYRVSLLRLVWIQNHANQQLRRPSWSLVLRFYRPAGKSFQETSHTPPATCKLPISPKLVLLVICEMRCWFTKAFSAICSWVQPRRFNRIITMFRPTFWHALMSEIQVFTVCCITPNFFASEKEKGTS